MRRRVPVRRLSAALGAVGALTLSLAGPAIADDVPPPYDPPTGVADAPVTPGGPMQAAQQQAVSSGQPVVVDTLTTQTQQTVAEPDGSFSQSSYPQPVRVTKDGAWTAVNATLVANADGTFSPAATPNGVELSGGGTGPLATLTDGAGHVLSYTFPASLPAPAVSGDSALYQDVLPGVDLRTTVDEQGGFSEVLVVHDATAAANPLVKSLKLTTSTQNLDLTADAAGNISAKTSGGAVVYTSPTPVMWDSSEQAAPSTPSARSLAAPANATNDDSGSSSGPDGPGPGAQVAPVGVAADAAGVTLTPDADLLNGSSTTFPVYIDPYTSPVTNRTGHYVETQQGCAGAKTYDVPQDHGEGIGFQNYVDNCRGLERSFYEMNTSALTPDMVIQSATLTMTETYGADGTCSHTWPVTLVTTSSGIDANTTWSNQPGSTGPPTTKNIKPASSGCGNQTLNFDVTSKVASLAQAGTDTWTFGLRGDEDKTESANYGFMRFSTNPYITTVFDIPPHAPAYPATDDNTVNPSGPQCGGAQPVGWMGRKATDGVGNSDIFLQAELVSPMQGYNMRADFQVWDNQTDNGSGGPVVSYPASVSSVPSYATAKTSIGITVKDGHQYGWGVRAYDGHLYGPWTSDCHFNVDLTPPTLAQFTDSEVFPPLGSGKKPTAYAGETGATLHVTSSDPMPSGCTLYACVRSGVDRFLYSLDSPIPATGALSVAATVSGGTGSADIPIILSAQQWGTHTLYVEPVDKAGNGLPTTYSFYAPWNPNAPVHSGDLTDDGIPDLLSPAGDNLYLTAGNSDTSATPEVVSTKSQSPDGTAWNNYIVAHRGSLHITGVDDLIAYRRATTPTSNDAGLFVYLNDASGLAADDPHRPSAAGHFTKLENTFPITAKPTCSGDCTAYDTTWQSVDQMVAIGNSVGDDGPPDLVTVEDGHLWYYSGSNNPRAYLNGAELLGTGDWSNTTLLAPGDVGGTLTLWVRDKTTGAVHTYPIPLGSDNLPTTLLTAPSPQALTSVVQAAGGPSLCAAVQGTSTAGAIPVQLAGCAQSAAQKWTLGSDGSVHASGRCLDTAGGGTDDGTRVQADACTGSASQKWQPGTAGALVNTASGRCMADPGSDTAVGTQLILWTCDSGPEQNWSGSATGSLPSQVQVLPVGMSAGDYPVVASPGDVNGPTGGADGDPDLYAVSPSGRYTELPGQAAVNGVAQFAAPVTLGFAMPPTDQWRLTDTTDAVDHGDPARGLTAQGGAVFTSDPDRGTVLSLNGTTAYAETGTSVLATDSPDGFSVSAWVKPASLAANATFVSQSDSAGVANGFQLYYSATAHAWAFDRVNDDSGGTAVSAAYGPSTGAYAPTTASWTHLVGVYDASLKQLHLYVNGHMVGSAGFGGTTSWAATGHLQIGRRLYQSAYGEYADGLISDVQTYSRALTPGEACALQSDPPMPTQLS